MAARLL
jgi:transposase-like protein